MNISTHDEQLMKKDAEQNYKQITSLLDLAEDLASTIESDFVKSQDAQIALVEPLITQIADSADILTEEYINILEKPGRAKAAKGRVESALRKLFMALEEYREAVGIKSKKALAGVNNIADPIVEKVRKQAEKIILVFMQLIELSLDRIMHKYEIDEFKRNNAKIISSLPQLAH